MLFIKGIVITVICIICAFIVFIAFIFLKILKAVFNEGTNSTVGEKNNELRKR